ncbi:phosducin-like protein [Nematostella vectensis]|uniref:phosducin-like protein n=1 Tax=Nematostella vectensis TaxID=45351 RepID=UPI001390497D|nr:phosducin-like protein [Nematostella vectensis]
MTTLDDRLLGEKRQNYVSSSESEGEEEEPAAASVDNAGSLPPNMRLQTPKTGPKGVIQDFRRYKQLETEHKKEQEEELKALAKKFSLSCQTSLEDEQEKQLMKELEIEEDEFLKQYHLKRLLQMKDEQQQKIAMQRHRFGKVIDITSQDEFLAAIDKEPLHVVIVIHLYDQTSSCVCMNECLNILAQQFPMVKFCRVEADKTGISKTFRKNGLPALLAYKATHMIGNFVQLRSILGDDFFASDVESFLIENGIISDEEEQSSLQARKMIATDQDEDSDLDLD